MGNGIKACCFDCYRLFLPIDHEFRTQENAFRKATVLTDERPRRLTEEVQAQMNSRIGDTKNFGEEHNWTYVSCFWQLPYLINCYFDIVRIGPIRLKSHLFLKLQSMHSLVSYCLTKW